VILTVTSHKGGVAKTTTAMHLAAYLERRDGAGSTVVVDADPNGSALGWARRSNGRLGFRVVSSREAQERRVVREFENVVVDTQGRPRGEGLRRLVSQCDLLVVPTTPEAGSTETIMLMAQDINALGGPAEYRVLLTMVKWYNRRAAAARRSLEKRGVPMFRGEVRDRAAFATAELRGLPVYEIKGKGARDGWADYEAIGREVAG
jgi:chromosome partitioning protein